MDSHGVDTSVLQDVPEELSRDLPTLADHLRRLHRSGGVTVEAGGVKDSYEVMLFAPASETDLASLQLVQGKRLPAEFADFLRFSNGANLFVNDSGMHGVGIASVELLADLQAEEEEQYSAAALQPYLVFGRVNGAGDFLVFEIASGRVLDGVHAEQPHEWRSIAESFTEWLRRFLLARGAYYWIEALYESPAS